MSIRDPFELLAALNPVASLSETSPDDDALFATIIASTPSPTGRRRRSRRLWITGGTAVTVLGLAAFAVLRQDSASSPLQLTCYTTAQQPPPEQFGIPMEDDPVKACEQLWRNGTISGTEPPTLTACVNDGGIVAVIPGDQQICGQLGLANWVGALTDNDKQLIAFADELTATFAAACITEPDARAAAQAVIDKYRLDGWTIVQRGGYTPQRACSLAGAVPEEHLVVIASRRGTP